MKKKKNYVDMPAPETAIILGIIIIASIAYAVFWWFA
jgi:hypothetical protein